MKILIGTTNPSKISRFEGFLSGCDVEFYTLRDLKIEAEPMEIGKDPRENAEIKARFYGQFFDVVICNDSGLYFDCLPLDDPRQPGLNIRTPNGRERMSDEESIEYYSSLVHTLGGRVLAYYVDGIAVYPVKNLRPLINHLKGIDIIVGILLITLDYVVRINLNREANKTA